MNCLEFVQALTSVIAVIVSVIVYVHTVRRESQINTIAEFSRIRNSFPNMSPYAEEPVDNKKRLDYLREMERFCTGINEKIYDLNIVCKIGGNLLVTQYDRYMKELVAARRKDASESWKYCEYEKVIEKIRKRKENEEN